MIVIFIFSMKVNLRSISFLVPDSSQGIGESVFVASMTEQGKFFKKGNCVVRFFCSMIWQLLRERKFACSLVLQVGKNLSLDGQGFAPSIETLKFL